MGCAKFRGFRRLGGRIENRRFSACDDDREIRLTLGGREVFRLVVLTASFNQFSRDVAGDFESFPKLCAPRRRGPGVHGTSPDTRLRGVFQFESRWLVPYRSKARDISKAKKVLEWEPKVALFYAAAVFRAALNSRRWLRKRTAVLIWAGEKTKPSSDGL